MKNYGSAEQDELVGAGLIASRNEIDGPPIIAHVGGAKFL